MIREIDTDTSKVLDWQDECAHTQPMNTNTAANIDAAFPTLRRDYSIDFTADYYRDVVLLDEVVAFRLVDKFGNHVVGMIEATNARSIIRENFKDESKAISAFAAFTA